MKAEAGFLIASASASGLVMLPVVVPALGLGDFLDPRLRIYAAGFGIAWTGYRTALFVLAWLRWRSWRRPASWQVRPQDLGIESARRRLPPGWGRQLESRLPARWAERMYGDKGILIGRGFRWGPEHTQALEDHLQSGRALPVGRDVRGGHPALHAVGRKSERAAGGCRGASSSGTC